MMRLKILICTSFFIALYAMYFWLTPVLINIGSRVEFIEKFAKEELNADINIKNPMLKMGLIPSIWLSLDKFELINKNGSKAFECNDIKLKLNLLPLIFKKLELGYFQSSNLNAQFILDKKYKLFLGDYLIDTAQKGEFTLSGMYLDNYNISLSDKVLNKNVKIVGDYLKIDDFDIDKHIKLSTCAKLPISNSIINADIDVKLPLNKNVADNDFLFNSTITNLNLEDFSSYITKFTKNDIKKSSGIINIEANSNEKIKSKIVATGLEIIRKDLPSSIIFKDKVECDIEMHTSSNTLIIDRIKLFGKSMDAQVFGKIYKLNSKTPNLDITIDVKPSKMQDYVALLPGIDSKEDINLYLLKKYGYFSDITGNLNIKGEVTKPKLTGKVLATNGYIVKPITNGAKKATVKLTFMGENLLMDVIVPSGPADTVFVKGLVGLYGDKYCDFRISSTKNINLEVAQSVLNPLHQVLNFELGPVPIMTLKGFGNIDLDVKGNKQHSVLNGYFTFRDTTASFNDINMFLKKAVGRLDFKNQDTHFVTTQAFLENKPMKIDGTCTLSGVLDFDATANAQDLGFLLNILKTSPMLKELGDLVKPIEKAGGEANLTLNLTGKIRDISEVVLGKTIFASGNIKLLNSSVSVAKMPSVKNINGNIGFKNFDLKIDLTSNFNKSKVFVNGVVKSNIADIKVFAKKFQITDISELLSKNLDYLKLFKGFGFDFDAQYKGSILKIDLSKLHINSKVVFNNTKLKSAPITFVGGTIEVKNNLVLINNLNILVDSMPLFLNGKISNIFVNPTPSIYVNSKPNQLFVEKYINKKTIYPLKLKGDIVYTGSISGDLKNLKIKSKINMEENASIYYMGATIGDDENPMNIISDIILNKTSVNVLNFQINKFIASQNEKLFLIPQLNAKGIIELKSSSLRDFKIKTQRATDAKIFNIIFKKPLIKQGQFNSNLTINGQSTNPKIVGDINFTGVNLPLLDTTIRDVSFNFNSQQILMSAVGEILGNKLIFSSTMKNSLVAPYVFENIDLYFNNLNLNTVIKSLNKFELEGQNISQSTISPESLIIKSAKVKADNAEIKNIKAKNLTANLFISDRMLLRIEEFKLNIAQGELDGNFEYNLLNNKQKLTMTIKDVNANLISDALFDLPNQIYGNINGTVNLACNGKTHKICMSTLSGQGGFEVNDGKMPKLGSLEYLLKAGNLVKSGITGLSINGIIDLITPLKTGNFKTIKGNFEINQGVANSIQIFSQGKDLSLFLSGTYNFSTLIADMNVLGRLSKKISTVLGPVGNLSLNSLFNKIPGVDLTDKDSLLREMSKIPGLELSESLYRIFTVKIYGDINGDNYVQSFRWVE